MAKIKVGINGFGRIGRLTTRLLWNDPDIELVAINDLTPLEQNAHLLKYDSVHGVWPKQVTSDKDTINIDGTTVKCFSQRDPSEIPWGNLGADIVFESTGIFSDFDGASKHLKGGAKKVMISAPTKTPDKVRTFVYGINHESYDAQNDHIVSNASCTTNCLAPVAKVLNDAFGITRGLMTTIHSFTNDQRTLDIGHSDLRRARAASLSMIPTTTGAAKAVGLVIPELKGKVNGLAVRVPTPNVSLVDFVADVSKPVTAEQVNEALATAAAGPLKGILVCSDGPLVSIDFNGNTASSSVDTACTQVADETMVKVLSWYDNEAGFSARMLDLTKWMAKSL